MNNSRGGVSEAAPYNATVDLLERNLVSGKRERVYLQTTERSWSYQEVAECADAAGAGMLDVGLVKGDKVILATGDRHEFVLTFWGAIKAGIVPVPVAPILSSSEFRFILTDSEARAIVCDASSATSVAPAAESTQAICLFAGDHAVNGTTAWADVLGRPSSLSAAATKEEDIAIWLYTSGTTGLPKAVMHRHRHLREAPNGLATQVLAMGSADVVLSTSRMYFAYGLGNSVYLPAAAGASVVLSEAPVVPGIVQDLLIQSEASILFGVPSFFRGFARLPPARLPPALRLGVSAGETLDVALFNRFERLFGLPLLDGLGSTEALHHVTSNRPGDIVPGSAGRALDGFAIRVLDRDQQPVPEGGRGELWLRGPTTFAGYWRRPELSERAYLDGWMRTGDLARIVDGRLYHEGRLDDLIKLGGILIAPTEIEDVLRGHPDVIDASVVATDKGAGVPVLRAFVVSKREGPKLATELRRLCRARLARFKIPQSFELVAELPREGLGHLQRIATSRDLV